MFVILRKAANLLRRDPAMFVHVLRYRLLHRQALVPPMPGRARKVSNKISRTIEDAARAVNDGTEFDRILIYGDHAFHRNLLERIAAKRCQWASSSFTDQGQGAANINFLSMTDFDCVVVGGSNVQAEYCHVLRLMHASGCCRPVFWVADGFEFCSGTLPIPAECTDADAYIFNHFEDFFGLKDPLLVKIEIFDQASSKLEWIILPPREAFRLDLNEWLPNRQGPACISHFTAHPILTRGRHYRWRATGNMHWANSTTTLHGSHDFRGPSSQNEFKISRSIINRGNIVITLPNYNLDITEEGAVLECVDGQKFFSAERSCDHRIEQINFRNDGLKSEAADFVGCKYLGHGGSFWFSFDEAAPGPSDVRCNLAANHTVRAWLREPPDLRTGVQKAEQLLTSLSRARIIDNPHALPVTAPDCPIEFGFHFDANVPALKHFLINVFDYDGKLVTDFPFAKEHVGPTFAEDILRHLDEPQRDKIGLIVVSPDWHRMNLDPRGVGLSGDLIARHRITRDFDVTEFQSCWRNLGVQVDEFPHWRSQDRMLTGRTNVMVGIPAGEQARPAILLVNGSGALDYTGVARFRLRLLSHNGTEIFVDGNLKSFAQQWVWLDECFPDMRTHLNDSYGTLIVQSKDADLNATLVVVWGGSAVSLQHMWGY